jgi:hypothetical protein
MWDGVTPVIGALVPITGIYFNWDISWAGYLVQVCECPIYIYSQLQAGINRSSIITMVSLFCDQWTGTVGSCNQEKKKNRTVTLQLRDQWLTTLLRCYSHQSHFCLVLVRPNWNSFWFVLIRVPPPPPSKSCNLSYSKYYGIATNCN